jgi:NADPH:quinone reductase-like Zn-dependent oxidoreductase
MLTESRGVDIVIDSIGGQNLVDSSVLAYRGTLVSVGAAVRAGSAIEAQSLWVRDTTLRGVWLGGAMLPEYARSHTMTGDMLGRVATGELHVEIDRSSRSRTPPPRTNTSRAARRSAGPSSRPDKSRSTTELETR